MTPSDTTKKIGELAIISSRAGLPDSPIFLVVSDVVTGLPFYDRSCLGVLVNFCLSLSSLFPRWVSKVLGRTDSWLRAISWEVFSLTSVFINPWQDLWAVFPYPPRAFFIAVFPNSVRRRKSNRDNSTNY